MNFELGSQPLETPAGFDPMYELETLGSQAVGYENGQHEYAAIRPRLSCSALTLGEDTGVSHPSLPLDVHKIKHHHC